MCGETQNMTAYKYAYNVAGNISFNDSWIVARKQSNVFEMVECISLCKNNETLIPK